MKFWRGTGAIRNGGLDHAREILASFRLCLKNPSEAELRDDRSLRLAEDISRHEKAQAGVGKQL